MAMSDNHETVFAFSAVILLVFSVITLPFVASMPYGLQANLHPPIVVNDKVIGGANLNGRAESPLGFLYALDQNTGDVIWITNMTDALTSGRSYGNKLMKI